MKRAVIVTFCLFIIAIVQAQTFNYTGLEIKQEKVKKKNVYEWEHFIKANYGLNFMNGGDKFHSFGITYGQVKLFGWYTTLMFGTGFHYKYDYEANWNGSIDMGYNDIYPFNTDIYPFYTGKTSYNRAAITAGGIVRMVIPLYLYAGIGYGYQNYTRQISSGDWVKAEKSLGHHFIAELGLQGNIKGFTLSAGYAFSTGHTWMQELKFGLGYTFKKK